MKHLNQKGGGISSTSLKNSKTSQDYDGLSPIPLGKTGM